MVCERLNDGGGEGESQIPYLGLPLGMRRNSTSV